LLPLQVQFQGPVPLTLEAVPAVQRLAVGALVNVLPLLDPQLPATAAGAELPQLVVPPLVVPLGAHMTTPSFFQPQVTCCWMAVRLEVMR
jgi:hypothetical protein